MSILKQLFDATHRADKLPEESDLDFAVRMGWDAKEEKRIADEARYAEARRVAAELNADRLKEETFIPKPFTPWHFTVLITAKPCVYCAKPTSPRLGPGPFPTAWRADFDAQCARAGIQPLHHWHDNNFPVCVACKDKGADTFECVCCKMTRQLNESHVSFGMPSEHVCTTCYETVPAKKWAALVGELEEQHRYDFE